MSVRIRMKQMGRKHRHFFRICATDTKNPRDGRIIEELGTYDPHIKETDARVTFNQDRLAYWLSVGALPSEHVAVFIKKYGPQGSHLDQQKSAVEKVRGPKALPDVGEPKYIRKTKAQADAEAAALAAEAAVAHPGPEGEAPAAEAPAAAAESAPAAEAPAPEAPAAEAPAAEATAS